MAELEQYREEAAAMQTEIMQLGDVITAQESTAAAEQELRTRVSRPPKLISQCSTGLPTCIQELWSHLSS